MEIQLTAKHLKVTPTIREYVEQKMEKAQKYFDHIIWGQAFLSVEKRSHNAEFLVHAPGQTFRALATAADLYSAVDLASDKIDGQIKKFKERVKKKHKAREADVEAAAATLQAPPPGRLRMPVVKQTLAPMSAEEAVEEMDSLGLSFRMYLDKDTEQILVVYRGNDDGYKILQPVKKNAR